MCVGGGGGGANVVVRLVTSIPPASLTTPCLAAGAWVEVQPHSSVHVNNIWLYPMLFVVLIPPAQQVTNVYIYTRWFTERWLFLEHLDC